jgi:hypothetical protein
MWNGPEVVREVGVNDFRVASKQQLLHLVYRLQGVAPRPVGVLLWWKIGFEDRFEHQHRCRHAHPIAQDRDAQRPQLAIVFRDKHSSDRLRSVRFLPERKRQFAQPPLHTIRLNVREFLTIYARRTLVRAALSIGMRQNIFAVNLVVQRVEAVAGFCLRFRV